MGSRKGYWRYRSVHRTYRGHYRPSICLVASLPHLQGSLSDQLFPALSTGQRLNLAHFDTKPRCLDALGRGDLDSDRPAQMGFWTRFRRRDTGIPLQEPAVRWGAKLSIRQQSNTHIRGGDMIVVANDAVLVPVMPPPGHGQTLRRLRLPDLPDLIVRVSMS